MASSAEAVGYVYQNVGVLPGQIKSDVIEMIYSNVGVVLVPLSPEAAASLYEFVNTAAPLVPHLWKVNPREGVGGDDVEIWGQGFVVPGPGGDYVKFYLGAQPGWNGVSEINAAYEMVQISAIVFVAATGDAYGPARSIPPGSGTPNVEHWKAIIEVPAAPAVGNQPLRAQVLDNP